MNPILRRALLGAALALLHAHTLPGQTPEWQLLRAGNADNVAVMDDGSIVLIDHRTSYRSTDGGAGWESPVALPTMFNHGTLVLRSYSNNLLYAGGREGNRGLYRSTDGGRTWHTLWEASGYVGVWDVAFRSEAEVFLATEPGGLQRSTNGGAAWTRVMDETDPWMWSVALGDGGMIYAGAQGEGIFRSTDDGESWTNPLTSGVVYRIAVGEEGMVYAAMETEGLYRSTDNGLAWSETSLGATIGEQAFVFDVQVHEQSGRVYARASGGIYRSDDRGETWAKVAGGPQQTGYHDFIVDDDGTLYVATGAGLYKVAGSPSSVDGTDEASRPRLDVIGDVRGGASAVLLQTPRAAQVRLALYDLHGRMIAMLYDARLEAGEHRFAIDLPEECSSGSYVCRATVEGAAVVRSLTIVR